MFRPQSFSRGGVVDVGCPVRPADAATGAGRRCTRMTKVLPALADAAMIAWRSAPHLLFGRIVLTIGTSVVPVGVAWLTKVVLDGITRSAGGGVRLVPVLGLAALGVLAAVLPQVSNFVDREMRRVLGLAVRTRLYRAVVNLKGLASLENPQFHDRLKIATEMGPAGPSEVVAGSLAVGQGALTIVGFVGTLAYLNPWMVLVVALAAVPTLRAETFLARRRARLMWELGPATRRELFYANLLTSLTAAKEVRLFGLGDLFGTRMIAELRRINKDNRRMDLRELVSQGLLALLGAVVAGGGLVWAVAAAGSGRLTVGDVAVFIAAVAGVQSGLSTAIAAAARAHESMLVFGHFRFIDRAGPDLAEPPSPVTGSATVVPPLRRGIELRDVWFRYGEALPWVLRGVNLTLPAGRCTALVGLNGAGKSTLVKLLCRFYDPTRGAVLWDGVDLRDLPVDELRRRIGVVFQDFMEYELSAAENIGVGNLEALGNRELIEAAARRAGCHEALAALPMGYDTLLTRIFTDLADRDDPGTGVVLSGGQSQRLALARALLRDDCDLLILDEPSAGLDAAAEYEMSTRLREHRQGRTSLLISHRLSTVRDADSIVVLGDGVVVESGSHEALLAAGGRYAELFNLQAAGYRNDPFGLAEVH